MSERITVDGVDYVRAYPVVSHRCPHCGGRAPYWTPGRIIAAFRSHAERHGRGPKQSMWAAGTPEHPAFDAVRRTFGSWRKGMAAAGVRPGGGRDMWTAERVVERITDWHFLHGEPPRVNDWRKADGLWPSEATVRKHFGTFNSAVAAAGITPRQKGSRYPVQMPGQRRLRLLPAEPFAEAVRSYVADGSYINLAELAGVDDSLLTKLAAGRKTFLREDTAEAVATAISRPDLLAVA